MSYAEPERRSLLVAGLRDLAAYLEAHPGLPAPHNVDAMVFPDRDSDSVICAEVDRIATMIGSHVTDERREFGHYRTSLSFGPVTYSAVAILADAHARYDALMSYHHSVIPDMATAPRAMDGR